MNTPKNCMFSQIEIKRDSLFDLSNLREAENYVLVQSWSYFLGQTDTTYYLWLYLFQVSVIGQARLIKQLQQFILAKVTLVEQYRRIVLDGRSHIVQGSDWWCLSKVQQDGTYCCAGIVIHYLSAFAVEHAKVRASLL